MPDNREYGWAVFRHRGLSLAAVYIALLPAVLSASSQTPAGAAAQTRSDSGYVSAAVAGQQRVGLRQQGGVVLAFTSDEYEGECHVGRRVSPRMIKFRYRRSSGDPIRFRMPMRHVRGRWIPRRSVEGTPMTPSRVRKADRRQLNRCLRWMAPNNPQLEGMRPLTK